MLARDWRTAGCGPLPFGQRRVTGMVAGSGGGGLDRLDSAAAIIASVQRRGCRLGASTERLLRGSVGRASPTVSMLGANAIAGVSARPGACTRRDEGVEPVAALRDHVRVCVRQGPSLARYRAWAIEGIDRRLCRAQDGKSLAKSTLRVITDQKAGRQEGVIVATRYGG